MANFESVYNLIKDKDNIHKRDSGTLFEEIVKVYLQHDIKYKNVFKNVWLWSEFPNNTGSDTGIDIVAEDLNGGYVAVQCKFYAMDKKIDKKDLDSFLSESGKEGYVERIVVATTNNWTNNANNAVENQTIPVKRIGLSNLEESNIDFLEYLHSRKIVDVLTKKTLREYQIEAIANVKEGFRSSDRGKLIMACGTGKTFTSLKIMEDLLKEKTKKEGARVLFLVPSLALLSQTHKEWSEQTDFNLKQLAVCSDSNIGKETEDYSLVDLEVSATTDSKTVIKHSKIKENEISVIYSTYHSLEVIYDSQQKGLDEFDLVICDEAHRTVGIKVGSEESYFTKIHDGDYIKAKKRLYMTATPKIYSESIKKKGEENNIEMFSMDDEKNYGKEFYKLGFSEAVEKKLLTDYKVLVLAISEGYINATMQQSLSNTESELNVNDTAKIVGCWNALSKRMDDFLDSNRDLQGGLQVNPMQRAVAFCSTIKDSKNLSGDDDNKKHVENTGFKKVIEDYYKNSGESLGVKVEDVLNCSCMHVDGKMNSMERQEKLRWLKDENIEKNECRILFNARCLSEGVDVPTLDAVIFMQPRKSNIDIIQAVGRVMRRAKNKDWGYIILPIVVKAGVKPEDALNDNEAYSVVWDVLRALRSIDERLDITINSVEFKKNLAKHVDVIGIPGKELVENQEQFVLNFGNVAEYKDAIYAKIVQKCGDRIYWEKWANDVADIAEKNILRINGLIDKNIEAREVFNTFLLGLHKNINSDIGRDEAIEMLAQHMITKPIFNAIFMDYDFAANNVISKEM